MVDGECQFLVKLANNYAVADVVRVAGFFLIWLLMNAFHRTIATNVTAAMPKML